MFYLNSATRGLPQNPDKGQGHMWLCLLQKCFDYFVVDLLRFQPKFPTVIYSGDISQPFCNNLVTCIFVDAYYKTIFPSLSKRPPCFSIEQKVEKDVEIFRSEVDLSRRENKPWHKKHFIEFDSVNEYKPHFLQPYSIMTHYILFNTNIQFWSEKVNILLRKVFSNIKLY